jgi:hypothetical protein
MAAVGTPAITTPNQMLLRPVQAAVQAIRERIEKLEAAVIAVQNSSASSSLQSTVTGLQIQVAQIQAAVNALSAATTGTETETLIAGAAISAYDVVYGSASGQCKRINPADPATIYNPLGVATSSAVSGASVTVQLHGVLNVSTAAFTTGQPVFVSADGTLTQHPNYENVAIPVGMALSATVLYVQVGLPSLQYLSTSPAEFWMPVTYGLMHVVLDLLNGLLVQPNGLVVLDSGSLITRTLVAGSNITIAHPDGVTGNPIINSTGSAGSLNLPNAGTISLVGLLPNILATLSAVPGPGAVTITGLAPAMILAALQSPGAGAVSFTGLAPSLQLAFQAAPDAGTVNLVGAAPTLSANFVAQPGAGAVNLVGAAPSLSLPQAIQPGAGVVSFVGAAPALSANFVDQPDAGVISLNGAAPALLVNSIAQPGAGTIATAGAAPTLSVLQTVQPGAGTITLAGAAPALQVSILALPGAGNVSLTGLAPTLVFPAQFAPGAGNIALTGLAPSAFSDAFRSSVVLLLHGDGTNGSTTFTDNSPNPLTPNSVNGNVQISTTQFKFGGASIAFDGNGDYLEYAANLTALDPAGNDFCIEFWWRPAAANVDYALVVNNKPTVGGALDASYGVQHFGAALSGKVRFYTYDAGQTQYNCDSTGALNANQWYHIAATRNGTTLRLFIDGTLQGTGTTMSAPVNAPVGRVLRLGRYETTVTRYANGFLDDLRITIGAGRYTANFTVPQSAYPNF